MINLVQKPHKLSRNKQMYLLQLLHRVRDREREKKWRQEQKETKNKRERKSGQTDREETTSNQFFNRLQYS